MASRRTNFGERREPAPDRGGKFQSAGGGGGIVGGRKNLYFSNFIKSVLI